MFCSISGEIPQIPVLSRKSGQIFEKRLIEAYISENGRDPVTNEECSVEDLIEVKCNKPVNPRPPSANSIPSLISLFQNEWDSIALESFNLRKQLQNTRLALSTALYQYDAACRVISRLLAEKENTTNALNEIVESVPAEQATRPMNHPLSNEIKLIQEKLFKQRKVRKTSIDALTSEYFKHMSMKKITVLKDFQPTASWDYSPKFHAIFDRNRVVNLDTLDESDIFKAVINTVCIKDDQVFVGSQHGTVSFFGIDGLEKSRIQVGSSSISTICVHPELNIIAVGTSTGDWYLVDVTSSQILLNGKLEADPLVSKFHPDGHLICFGLGNGKLTFIDSITGKIEASLENSDQAVSSIQFSENGYFMASAYNYNQNVYIWDLRKSAIIDSIPVKGKLGGFSWDDTGKLLSIADPKGLSILKFDKAGRKFVEIYHKAMKRPAAHLYWISGVSGMLLVLSNGEICKFNGSDAS